MAKPHPHLLVVGSHWYYYRRVPAHLAEFDPRRFVKTTTKVRVVDDPKATRRALKVAMRLDEENQRYWSDLIQGRGDRARLKAAIKRAQLLGFVYHSAEDVAKLPLPEILDRTFTLLDDPRTNVHDEIDRMALLGGPTKSSILLSDLVAEYQDVVKLEIRNKSELQFKQWLEVRDAAVKHFMSVVGDKDLLSLTRDDGKAFRAWWSERITEDDLSTEGVRKEVNALRKMIRIVCEHHDLTDPEPFAKITFKASTGKREAFEIDFVRDVILAPNARNGLDPAVYDIMLICVDTGARASEIISMPKRDIHLHARIPYIDIRDGNGREVKTRNAERKLPLVGVALEAMRRNPSGFPQFHNNVKAVRNVINDWLRTLQPSVNEDDGDVFKTLHCLRHTFKDRLRKTSAREEMLDAVLGHANGSKPLYGSIDLEAKLEVMQQLVFSRAPASLIA